MSQKRGPIQSGAGVLGSQREPATDCGQGVVRVVVSQPGEKGSMGGKRRYMTPVAAVASRIKRTRVVRLSHTSARKARALLRSQP